MRKQPLPRNQLQQAILKCVIASSALLVVNTSPSLAAPDGIFAEEPTACDFIYGVNDDELNNSQFFKINPNGNVFTPIGITHPGFDIEALDVSASGVIYVASGDNTDDVSKAGYLYTLDPITGELTEVCPTGFAEVDGLSINPLTQELYGWAQDAGLIKIALPPVTPETACADLIYESRGEFEDLTWSNDGMTLYVVKNDHGDYPHQFPYVNATYTPDPENDGSVPHKLIAYNILTGTETSICEDVIGPLGEIEALEVDITNNLLFGYHNSKNKPMMATLNPGNCELQLHPTYPTEVDGITNFNDVEALGVCPCVEPMETEWAYAADAIGDVTGLRSLEIKGMAIKVKNNTIMIAISANMGADGIETPPKMKVADHRIQFSDLGMAFANGSEYFVHYSPGNDSSVTDLGVYKNVKPKDVTKENNGFSRLVDYLSVLGGDGKATMGEFVLPDQASFIPMNMYEPRSLNMSIETGDRVQGDNFTELSEAELEAEGLDFAANLGEEHVGSHIFGFQFTKQRNMHGYAILWTFTECSNDGIAIIGELPDCAEPNPTPPEVAGN